MKSLENTDSYVALDSRGNSKKGAAILSLNKFQLLGSVHDSAILRELISDAALRAIPGNTSQRKSSKFPFYSHCLRNC